MPSSPLAVGGRILHPHRDRVGDLTRTWDVAVAPHVGDDQRTVAEAQLRAVVLSDADPLDEPEGLRQPGHSGTHVGVDEHGDDHGPGHGPVRPHRSLPARAAEAGGQADTGLPISQ